MDILTIETLHADVLFWLASRRSVQVAPDLAHDPAALGRALSQVQAAIVPPTVAIDAATLRQAPRLRILGRLSAGAENIDLEACAQLGIEVVRPASANAQAEAEFVIAALLQMLRRVPIVGPEGLLLGRELNGCKVGIVGMTPAVRYLSPLLTAFGAAVLGHDPGVHASDASWSRNGIEAMGLPELMGHSDAVCVLLTPMPRYVGLFAERLLSMCKPDQVLLSLATSTLFDEVALARALREGPLAAAWLDNMEAGALDPGRPLSQIETLQVTPQVAGITQQSRKRSAWALAHRIDERLGEACPFGLSAGRTSVRAGLADG